MLLSVKRTFANREVINNRQLTEAIQPDCWNSRRSTVWLRPVGCVYIYGSFNENTLSANIHKFLDLLFLFDFWFLKEEKTLFGNHDRKIVIKVDSHFDPIFVEKSEKR